MWRNRQQRYIHEHSAPDYAKALHKAESTRAKNRQKRKNKSN